MSFWSWQRKPLNELAAFAASDTDHCVGPPQPWQRVSVKACVASGAIVGCEPRSDKATREHSSCNCNLGGWLHHTTLARRETSPPSLSNIRSWPLAKRLSLPSREILCFGTRKQLPTSLRLREKPSFLLCDFSRLERNRPGLNRRCTLRAAGHTVQMRWPQ